MKRAFALSLTSAWSAVVLMVGLAALTSPVSGQEASQTDKLTRAGSTRTAPQAGLDPERDLKVSFSTKHKGGDDAGYVFGGVTNSSRSSYPCVHIEFRLVTRYDQREAGKGSSQLGTLGVDVKDVQPGAKTGFRAPLPSPAGVGLGSIGLCETAPEEEPSPSVEPSILSFEARPAAISPGDTVSLFWEVANAEQVLLFDDFGALESRITLPSGKLGWPASMNGAQKEDLSKTTTFTLVAVSETGRVTKSFTVNVQGKVIN